MSVKSEEEYLNDFVITLKKNTKNRSDNSIKNFKVFLHSFLKKYEIQLADLCEKKIVLDLKEEDYDYFIKNKSRSQIYFLEHVCKTYLGITDMSGFKELQRFKKTSALEEYEASGYKNEVKKEVGTPYMTNEELEKLYNSLEDVRLGDEKIFFLFLISTGIRRGAIREAKYEDIDFENEMIKVIEKGNIETFYFLTPELLYLLKKRPLAFLSFNTDYKIEKIMKNYKLLLGREDIHPHLFRFTFSRLVLNTNNAKDVQVSLNHKNIQTTQMCYIKETRVDKMSRMDIPWFKKPVFKLPYFLEPEYVEKFVNLNKNIEKKVLEKHEDSPS